MMDGKTIRNVQSVIPKYNMFNTLVHLVGFAIEIKWMYLQLLNMLLDWTSNGLDSVALHVLDFRHLNSFNYNFISSMYFVLF